MTTAGLSEIFKQVDDAAAGGGFVADDAHLSRTQLVLDEKGRQELAKELEAMVGASTAFRARPASGSATTMPPKSG